MTGPSERVENTRASGRHAEPPVENHAHKRPSAPHVARGQPWIVGEDRVGADGDRIDLRALPVQVAIGRGASEPHAFADAADEPIR